ncbi:MAG: ferrochelatase [Neisseriales bacterium]|nr:MAG: ferrochelatase [Neisseriales bacterium]
MNSVASQHSTHSPAYFTSCGVLLINFGTPTEPSARAIFDYLKNLLSDKHIVKLPSWLWQPMLWGIAQIRSRQLVKPYQDIWSPQGSPLHIHSQKQVRHLQTQCAQQHANQILIKYAMQYGHPAIGNVLQDLLEQGIEHLVVLPLYPQSTQATTHSALDQVWQYLMRYHHSRPIVHTISGFFEHPDYIAALADSVTHYWHTNQQGDKLLMSFHGLPQQPLARSRFYHDQCYATAQALAQALSLKPNQYIVSFQSRFGPQKWLQPYTKTILRKLGAQQTHTLDVICPGFMVDCLETLYEIAKIGTILFRRAGGHTLRYIPCLNSTDGAVKMLFRIMHSALPMLFCLPPKTNKSHN